MKNNKRFIYEEGYNFLLNYVSKEVLERHLNSWEKQVSINGIYEKMLHHGQNRRNLPSVINMKKRKPIFKEVLFDFSPQKVIDNYSSEKEIQNEFHRLIKESTKTISGKMWSDYCKTIFESAIFLKRFSTVEEFYNTFKELALNSDYGIDAPLKIRDSIFGYGLALSCDFLKEIGFTQFVKPDKHVIELTNKLQICNSNNDIVVFKSLINYANEIGEIPYRVDKIFYLIGSGNFYLDDIKCKEIKENFMCYLLDDVTIRTNIKINEKVKNQNKSDDSSKNRSNIYKPEEFENTDIFNSYSEFCKNAIVYLNDKFIDKEKLSYSICTRNNSDNKITFKIYSPHKRNLITLYPNKKLNYVKKIEIRDENNTPNPFIKEIHSYDDLDEVITRVKVLIENL